MSVSVHFEAGRLTASVRKLRLAPPRPLPARDDHLRLTVDSATATEHHDSLRSLTPFRLPFRLSHVFRNAFNRLPRGGTVGQRSLVRGFGHPFRALRRTFGQPGQARNLRWAFVRNRNTHFGDTQENGRILVPLLSHHGASGPVAACAAHCHDPHGYCVGLLQLSAWLYAKQARNSNVRYRELCAGL
jgi:hypothetical protein